MMIEEVLHGIGPLRAAPDKQDSFVASLAEALWYVADGRPYEELVAATCSAFAFGASAGVGCPGRWLERCPDLTLLTASRAAGVRLAYRETGENVEQDDPAWTPVAAALRAALEDRRPVLVRGGWSGGASGWGVVTGTAPGGLPAGHRWGAPQAAAEALAAPPEQLVFFERELARPAARELTVEILRNAARCLRGEWSGHVTLGRAWLLGPPALALWAERLEGRFCEVCPDDACCRRRVAAHYCSSRRWAGRFLADSAALRLGQVRPAREVGRLFDELARQEPTCAADVRRAAQAELQIAERIERLIGP